MENSKAIESFKLEFAITMQSFESLQRKFDKLFAPPKAKSQRKLEDEARANQFYLNAKRRAQKSAAKAALSVIILLISAASFAQPYVGIGVTNKGANFQFGILVQKVDFTIAYKVPLSKTDNPTILSINLGKQFLITSEEENNYSITPTVGIAGYKVKDFSRYDAETMEVIQVTTLQPIYGVELGKDAYLGRFCLNVSYCKGFYYGVGLKFFFKRN